MQSLRASPRLSSVRACSSRQRLVVKAASFDVRPYTLRKGDTLESIAKKRSELLLACATALWSGPRSTVARRELSHFGCL